MKHIKNFKQLNEDHSVYTNDVFWGTVGAGTLLISRKTKRILIGLRSKYVNEPHTWSNFGGQLDDMITNDPKQGCLTELEEETGYTGKIELIDAYIFEKKDDDGKNIFTYYNYIGIVDDEFEPILNWENSDYKWVTFDELLKVSPKHFGLEGLMENSKELIKKYI